MLDNFFEKQPLFCNYVKKIIEEGKISHAYLIETNGVDYGFDMAIALSKSLLCKNSLFSSKNCKNCSVCQNIDEGNYPDLKIIETTSKVIKKEQMFELQHSFSTKPLYGKYLIYIIKNAELLNTSSANTILKFLEEPSENIIAILLTNNIYNCIETIVSRCQILSLVNNNQKIGESLFKKYCEMEDIISYIKEESSNLVSYYEQIEIQKKKFLIDTTIYNYKDKLDLMLQFGLYLYMDVLNYKINAVIYNFSDYIDTIKVIVEKNEINDIIKKIDIISQFIEKSKLNVNKELFIDNLIITFCGGINEN